MTRDNHAWQRLEADMGVQVQSDDTPFPTWAASAQTRLYFQDGHIEHYDDPKLAYSVYLSLPKGCRVCFRSANDARPVYSHDYVDAR